jgi:hypothetical protein
MAVVTVTAAEADEWLLLLRGLLAMMERRSHVSLRMMMMVMMTARKRRSRRCAREERLE